VVETARIAGQALVFLLLVLGIGYLSQRPLLRPLPEGEGLVRLAMAVPGKLKGECRQFTEQELAKLAPNMRRPQDCPRERLPVRIRLELDGVLLREEVIEPSGIARDGGATAYWKLAVPAGRHELRARVSEDAAAPGFAYERGFRVDLHPGGIVTLDFDRQRGGILLR